MDAASLRTARRPRAFVGVTGLDAAAYLQRMVSNDVEALDPGEACEALLLTAKARLVAPLTVLRRGDTDFLLLTEPELGERLRAELLRFRFAAKCAIEAEQHVSHVVLGGERPAGSVPNADYGVPAHELLDTEPPATAVPIEEDELERLRLRAAVPRWGRELDERVLPAEAGLEERAISFTKGCFPGQEPVARLHYRGHPNRGLRVLEIDGDELPAYDAELTFEGKAVGRVTSAVADGDGVLALAYVRREVPADAHLRLEHRGVRPARFELATSASAGQRSIP
jgi:tRNA-modifying protein YgfZ